MPDIPETVLNDVIAAVLANTGVGNRVADDAPALRCNVTDAKEAVRKVLTHTPSSATPELIARLLAVNSSGEDYGVTCSYRNPDGPEAVTALQSYAARVEELEARDERVREAMFVLSDRLAASGILSASDAVHEAYEAVVKQLSGDGK